MKTWVIMCDGFQGCRTFSSFENAKQAADRLTSISGRKWAPRELTRGKEERLNDEYHGVH